VKNIILKITCCKSFKNLLCNRYYFAEWRKTIYIFATRIRYKLGDVLFEL